MPGKLRNLELPRRVVGYYLLFCLVAIAWLTVGVVIVSQSVLNSRAESTCLSQLGRASSAIVIDYLRRGEEALQPLIERYCSKESLAYCAVVSTDGRYLAHSSRDLVGRKCRERTGEHVQWGEVAGVRFVDSDSRRVLREYRTPLKSGDDVFGTLLIAVPEPDLWSTMGATAERAPLTILVPLAFIAAGAFVLRRMVRPLADVESQLRRAAVAPAISDLDFKRVSTRSACALGWNRLVDQLGNGHDQSSLSQRLSAAVEELRQQKADDILNSLSDGVAVTDGEGRITFVNPALAALLGSGKDQDALRGKRMEDCLKIQAATGPESALFDPDLRKRTVVVERDRSTDVTQEILRIARQPVRSADNASDSGHVWCVRDITQQKLAEKMRDQFLDNATHELRTPLANIKAYAETLALTDMLDVEQQKEFCNTINTEATRLARFIDDLLSVSSMEVGSLSLTVQNVDVMRLLQEVVGKVRPQMDQKGITFESILPEKLPKLKLDKDKISATLVNLLGNAAKYTQEGGRVALKVRWKDQELTIDVVDTGTGISKEELPRVFDKFFRSKDPRIRAETGTGLGLSLAREVVRLHGGELTAESELNEGSTFAVSLPMNGEAHHV